MTGRVLDAPAATVQRRAGLVVVVASTVAWLALFWPEARAAVGVWQDSTAYGHCFLVIPIAGWLAWERREAVFAALPARPLPWAALAALLPALAWFGAERVGVMEGRQLCAMTLLQVLALAVLGWRLYRVLSIPLLYLFFLVPFGGFLVPALQDFTARFVGAGLDALRVPNVVTHTLIEIPEGNFLVAEACAGLRFLIAAVAFGVLYACTLYRSPLRRTVFIAVSIAVPIVANGFRALGIVELGHLLGSARAVEVDHVLYGWLFFTLVILLLIAAGLPFREDRAAPVLAGPQRLRGYGEAVRLPRAVVGAAVCLLAAGLAVGGARWLDGVAEREAADQAGRRAAVAWLGGLAVPPGCHEADRGPSGTRQFLCSGAQIAVRGWVFGRHASPGQVWGTARDALHDLGGADTTMTLAQLPAESGPFWRVIQPQERGAALGATALWIGGAPSGGGLTDRLRQARASVLGDGEPPRVLAAVATPSGLDAGQPEGPRAALLMFLAAQPAGL